MTCGRSLNARAAGGKGHDEGPTTASEEWPVPRLGIEMATRYPLALSEMRWRSRPLQTMETQPDGVRERQV
jgi:hypothetical protein